MDNGDNDKEDNNDGDAFSFSEIFLGLEEKQRCADALIVALFLVEGVDVKGFRVAVLRKTLLLLKHYYNNELDRWSVATNRCIEAKKARWHSYRTFFDYFQEASRSPDSLLDYERLDKNRVYLSLAPR